MNLNRVGLALRRCLPPYRSFLGNADGAMYYGSLENLADLKAVGRENMERYNQQLTEIAETLVNS